MMVKRLFLLNVLMVSCNQVVVCGGDWASICRKAVSLPLRNVSRKPIESSLSLVDLDDYVPEMPHNKTSAMLNLWSSLRKSFTDHAPKKYVHWPKDQVFPEKEGKTDENNLDGGRAEDEVDPYESEYHAPEIVSVNPFYDQLNIMFDDESNTPSIQGSSYPLDALMKTYESLLSGSVEDSEQRDLRVFMTKIEATKECLFGEQCGQPVLQDTTFTEVISRPNSPTEDALSEFDQKGKRKVAL